MSGSSAQGLKERKSFGCSGRGSRRSDDGRRTAAGLAPGFTRRVLDGLYYTGGGLAAFFLAAIAVIVLMQVGANVITRSAAGYNQRSDEAGCSILWGLRRLLPRRLLLPRSRPHVQEGCAHPGRPGVGAHMRPRWRCLTGLWSSGFGAGLAGYFSWCMVGFVLQSWRFHDVSSGIVPVPLWIPQSAMAAGVIVLAIAAQGPDRRVRQRQLQYGPAACGVAIGRRSGRSSLLCLGPDPDLRDAYRIDAALPPIAPLARVLSGRLCRQPPCRYGVTIGGITIGIRAAKER